MRKRVVNEVPKWLNPYIKLEIIDVDKYGNSQNCLDEDNDVKLENESNQVIEDTKTLQVVLQKTKIFECKECYLCFTTERDYRLHLVKHAAPIVKTEFSYEKHSSYVKKFKCPDCDLRFVAESTLLAHSVVHLPFPYVCHCGIGYNKEDDFFGHKRLVHHETQEKIWRPTTSYAGKKLKSEFCIKSEQVPPQSNVVKTKLGVFIPKSIKKNKKKKVKSEFKPKNYYNVIMPDVKHEKISVGGLTKCVCPTCNKVYASYRGLQVHTLSHTGEKPYACDVCPKTFSQSAALNVHKLKHDGVYFECNICLKRLAQKAALKLHMRIHTGEKPYDCDFCGKAFSDPSAFARHIRTHTGDKRYQCTECPMRFSDKSGLIVHSKRHTGIRNFKCEICERRFYSKTHLKVHLSVHAPQYKYECDYCGKRFAKKHYLAGHIVRSGKHSALKCPFCPRTFSSALRRSIHLRVHDQFEFADYKCDHCGESYDGKASMIQHLKTEHS